MKRLILLLLLLTACASFESGEALDQFVEQPTVWKLVDSKVYEPRTYSPMFEASLDLDSAKGEVKPWLRYDNFLTLALDASFPQEIIEDEPAFFRVQPYAAIEVENPTRLEIVKKEYADDFVQAWFSNLEGIKKPFVYHEDPLTKETADDKWFPKEYRITEDNWEKDVAVAWFMQPRIQKFGGPLTVFQFQGPKDDKKSPGPKRIEIGFVVKGLGIQSMVSNNQDYWFKLVYEADTKEAEQSDETEFVGEQETIQEGETLKRSNCIDGKTLDQTWFLNATQIFENRKVTCEGKCVNSGTGQLRGECEPIYSCSTNEGCLASYDDVYCEMSGERAMATRYVCKNNICEKIKTLCTDNKCHKIENTKSMAGGACGE